MSENASILIVEDDDELAGLLHAYLQQHPFALTRVASGTEAVEVIQATPPDLVLLDLMLPGMNGLDVCREVRGVYNGAIVMLTASQSEADHVTGLELGADDFVCKPIEPRVLLARIRTQLRRQQGGQPAAQPSVDKAVLDIGALVVNETAREVRVENVLVPLTSMEFDVLCMLAHQAGEVVTRDDLYNAVLGVEYDGLDRGLDVHISRIRKKLVRCGFDASRLKGVRGAGYLLVPR